MERKKYYGIDWLRVLACFGIVSMHIMYNSNYDIHGLVYDRIIPGFDDLVYLFMAISGFGMCCGYYEKVISGKIDWEKFYAKRYLKILPFFGFLILIDIAMNFSSYSLMEGIAEMTLLHGFIPTGFSVIGVGWFLGVVFIFYMIFPFYCILLKRKYRAWFALLITCILNYICKFNYDMSRQNFIRCFCFFILGGLVYLYKDYLEKLKYYQVMPFTVISITAYYILDVNVLTWIFVNGIILTQGVVIKNGRSKIISFISSISMEIYLCHMVIFRLVEKIHITTLFGNGWIQYIITVVSVIIGAICFSFLVQTIIRKIEKSLVLVLKRH